MLQDLQGPMQLVREHMSQCSQSKKNKPPRVWKVTLLYFLPYMEKLLKNSMNIKTCDYHLQSESTMYAWFSFEWFAKTRGHMKFCYTRQKLVYKPSVFRSERSFLILLLEFHFKSEMPGIKHGIFCMQAMHWAQASSQEMPCWGTLMIILVLHSLLLTADKRCHREDHKQRIIMIAFSIVSF